MKVNRQEQTDLQEVTKNDTALQDEAIMPDRVPWKEESINAIHNMFAEEIATQNITISCLDEKYRATQYCLRKSPNGCMTESGRSGDSKRNLTAETKKQQIYQGKRKRLTTASAEVLNGNQQSTESSDILSPTETTGKSQGVFTPEQVQILLRLFQDMVNGALSKPLL